MARHLLHALTQALPPSHFWKIKLLQAWPSIIGKLADKVSLYKIDETSVTLSVKHASLAHELFFLSDMLRTNINNVIGEERIISISFRTHHATPARAAAVPPVKQPTSTPIAKPLSNTEQVALAGIKNKELREALSAFYSTCRQRKSSSS